MAKRCDGNFDCMFKEDELDCCESFLIYQIFKIKLLCVSDIHFIRIHCFIHFYTKIYYYSLKFYLSSFLQSR